jgi:membrane associated rhomboid family serine protease
MVIPLRDDNPTTRFALVTLLLIAVNVFVYFAVQPHGGVDEAEFILERAAIPCELRQGEPLTVDEYQTRDCDADRFESRQEFFPHKNVWLAVFTSMFLHGSILHLAGNMLFLWIFGNNVEDHLGPVVYVVFYAIVGVAATGAHFLADAGSTIPVIGASGAIAGVMGAYLVLWPHARVLTLVPLFLFLVVYLPAGVVLGIWFGLQFFTNPNEGVAWVAHVGGFGAGVVLGLGLKAILGAPRAPARSEDPF